MFKLAYSVFVNRSNQCVYFQILYNIYYGFLQIKTLLNMKLQMKYLQKDN